VLLPEAAIRHVGDEVSVESTRGRIEDELDQSGSVEIIDCCAAYR
jgi:hypothetical protein